MNLAPARRVLPTLEELGQQPFISNDVRQAIAQLGDLASKLPLTPIKIAGEAAKLIRPRLGDIVKVKAKVAQALGAQAAKLVIILDDIDRLTAEEIREVFRVVKSVADFPNVIYVLSFDREVARAALASVQMLSGDAYLEKIIQVPFDLPLPDKADLRHLLLSQLQALLTDFPEELPRKSSCGVTAQTQ